MASVGVKNPTSHVHQNMLRRRQHGKKDTAALKYPGLIFRALHDAMFADDQNPDIQRENVTTEIDRVKWSVDCLA